MYYPSILQVQTSALTSAIKKQFSLVVLLSLSLTLSACISKDEEPAEVSSEATTELRSESTTDAGSSTGDNTNNGDGLTTDGEPTIDDGSAIEDGINPEDEVNPGDGLTTGNVSTVGDDATTGDDLTIDGDLTPLVFPIDRGNWRLSASNNETDLSLAIDADSNSRWTSKQYQQANQWLEIDLAASYLLTAIQLDTELSPNDFPVEFELQVSSDGITWTTVATNVSGAEITQVSLKRVQAQQLRITLLDSSNQDSSEQYFWSVHELNISGELDQNPPAAFSATAEMIALEKIQNHILGSIPLTSTELIEQQSIIETDLLQFESNIYQVDLAFELIDLYDETYGALFTNGSKTDGGITSRTASGYELEHVILAIMQGIVDYSYSEANLLKFPLLFSNRKFNSSSFFPGAVSIPPQDNVSYSIKINASHVRGFGIPANYETADARRPTGTYLAPGSIATVTVPQALVGIGASILVGAHTWDLASKSSIKRMDRVTIKYDITDEMVTIANPLGGGIYINVPYEHDLGLLDITLSNVVQSPYYANTAANHTSVSQWQNEERQHNAPWADFESDKVMMQVPRSWIYAMDDPSNMMADWDLAMDGISELFARPLIRPKTAVYMQVDVIMRGGANFPGYPQSNISYDPDIDYGGNHNNFLLNGPRNQTGYLASVFFHELGHAENFHKFSGEVEASVNFLWVAVHNKKFGVELNQAFSQSRYNLNHTIEQAAQSWMIAENFRDGNPMSNTTGQYRQEFAYQPRGYAKYADIVRLFGWQALEQFFYNLNVDYENGVRYNYHVSNVPWDEMSLRLSIASGYNLTPLLHFWGIHPEDPAVLAAAIAANGLTSSAAIYDQLITYKTLPLQDNAAFRTFGLADFSESSIVGFINTFEHKPMSYYQGLLNAWWNDYDDSHAQAAQLQVQNIIDLYFPNGRP